MAGGAAPRYRDAMRTILVALAVAGCAAPIQQPIQKSNPSALAAALDADLRADWDALLAARRAVAAREAQPSATVLYHLGYIDWRLSSLAYMVTGTPGQAALTARAVDELRRAVDLSPTLGEAQALLAVCAAILANIDRSRMDELMPLVKPAWTAALGDAADSPRVQLLRAMSEFWMPPQAGGSRERGVDRWKNAIALFERERPPAGELAPIWGHAEAWAWLGGAYLMMGRTADAADALRHALALRPDFWWAKIALAQANAPQP